MELYCFMNSTQSHFVYNLSCRCHNGCSNCYFLFDLIIIVHTIAKIVKACVHNVLTTHV